MNDEKQQGNILVTSLILMVTMSLMGAGLIYKSVTESNSATFKTIEATTLQATESCTNDVIAYFEGLTIKPDTIDNDQFVADDLSYMSSADDSENIQNKLTHYNYDCDVNFLTSKNVSVEEGTAEDISSTGSEYGGSGGTTLKDYYQIVSNGSGPKNATKVLNTIISVEY